MPESSGPPRILRNFFERLRDWDYDDAPSRTLIFPGDFPQADEPLPKFLDDPTMEKFTAALANDPDPRRRVMVEILAQTGIRVGELSGLDDKALTLLGDTFYVGNTDGVMAFPYVAGADRITASGRKLVSFKPSGHWTRSLLPSPDGKKYAKDSSDQRILRVIGTLGGYFRTPEPGWFLIVCISFFPVAGLLEILVSPFPRHQSNYKRPKTQRQKPPRKDAKPPQNQRSFATLRKFAKATLCRIARPQAVSELA